MNFPREGVCSIWVQGLELSDNVLRDIISVNLTFREGKAADGSLTLSDVEFKYFDSKLFIKNRELSIIMGFSDDAVPFGPFIIKSLSVDAPDSGAPILVVNFQDLTHKLNKKKEKKRYSGKCETVFSEIATKNGLGYKIQQPKDVKFDEEKALAQANKTKAAIFKSLAERYGFVWGVEGKTLYFRRPNTLDEMGQQEFVPVLSYRINDCSIMSYTAEFNFTREQIKQGAKTKIENIDFENCQDTGSFVEDVVTGKIDLPSGAREALLHNLGIDIPPGAKLDEDTSSGRTSLTDKEQKVVDEINKVLSTGGTQANDLITAMQDNPFDAINAAAEKMGVKVDSNTGEVSSTVDYDATTNLTSLVGMFKETSAAIVKQATSIINGTDENEENGTKDSSGTATPSSKSDAEARAKAAQYKSVVVCDASIQPTISSPRYQPSMGVILCGLGERLSGKYRVTEVTLTYNHDSVFTSEIKCQKRFYGMSDEDKKKIAAATKAHEEGDDSHSSPGGPDKKATDSGLRVDYNAITNTKVEYTVTEEN